MSSTTIMQLQGISKNFRALQALDNVDFDLREGEVHAIVGENGAGKSTLMRILAGIYNEYEGQYLLDGRPAKIDSPRDALAAGIGMIHQELSVIPELSVAENIFLGRQPVTRWGTIDWGRMNEDAARELKQLGFELAVDQPLERYALGTQQVVEVLRTIISGARVLIMDEPTSALSPPEIQQLMELIDWLREQKRSIIYISHFLEEVMHVADRITVLRNGEKVDTLDRQDATMNRLIELILGRELAQEKQAEYQPANHRETLLEVTGLEADVFQDISFTLGKGEIIGIYGAIGAGHFDLARALFGLYRFDSGTIKLDGRQFPAGHSARYSIRNGLAYVSESRRRSLLLDELIYRNVTMPHLAKIGGMVPQRAQELAVAGPAIEKVNVQPPDPTNAVGKLSGGNQQKVAIARWLTFPPKVFITSEPTRGMDVGAKGEVMELLRGFRDEGYGVLVVSSEPETILAVAENIIVMSRGRIVARMANENLDKDALMRLL